jgi:hypothetical protein
MPNAERLRCGTRPTETKHHTDFASTAAIPQRSDAANDLCESYLQTVDGLLSDIWSRYSDRGISFHQLFSLMRGAYPTMTLDRLRFAGGGTLAVTPTSQSLPEAGGGYYPELHALDFEWYFDNQSARSLAQEFSLRHGRTLYLGTPTVAASAAQLGRKITLIDRNRLISDRFPSLSRNPDFHIMSVEQALELGIKANSVVFDAPWYLDDIASWLCAASHLVVLNGSVTFPIFPPLVRPAAKRERDVILDLASSIGSVSLTENAVTYETPLFEREALSHSGVCGAGNWRRGDLVVVRVTRSVKLPMISYTRSSNWIAWRTFVVGGQVIKIRSGSQKARGAKRELIQPLNGFRDFVYTSVSARDHAREHIDLWTSRNRVARLADTKLIIAIFELLQRGATVDQATDLLVNRLQRRYQLRSVKRAIDTVLVAGSA